MYHLSEKVHYVTCRTDNDRYRIYRAAWLKLKNEKYAGANYTFSNFLRQGLDRFANHVLGLDGEVTPDDPSLPG